MKLTWKKKKASSGNKRSRPYPNLPFDDNEELEVSEQKSADIIKIDKDKSDIIATDSKTLNPSDSDLAESFLSQGNQLAEDGRYREALMKWEAALTLMPERAVLHEQKAQVLLEIGDAWNALRAATRATELEPSWAESYLAWWLRSSKLGIGSICVKSEVRVEGLETLDYLDNLEDKKRFTEQGDAITFESEVDKIYVSTPTKIAILDHEKKRTFVLRKDGLPDAVVWNPWDRKAKAIPDLGDDDYKHMLCVEAAAVEKPITLKPGEEWKGRQELCAVPSSYCSGQLDPQRVLHG